MAYDQLKIFSGSANRPLAEEIAQELGVPLGQALVGSYNNGETRVRIEENVRGSDVFIVQPTCSPVNHHLMELLIMIDAVRRASAARITAVIPYFGYAKQEKKTAPREPISAKLVANLITAAGANRILTVDLHTPAIEGFFDIPVDHLRAGGILAQHLNSIGYSDLVVVSPDPGRVGSANDFRNRLMPPAPLAIIAKQRPRPDVAEFLDMVGDVNGHTAVVLDDMIMTGGTLITATNALIEHGAREVLVYATHVAFANGAIERLCASPIKQIVVTNTAPLPVAARPNLEPVGAVANGARVEATIPMSGSQVRTHAVRDKIIQLSVAPLLAEAIGRIHQNQSVSSLIIA